MGRKRSEEAEGFWQSTSDLAMGVMAVFALVMVLLVFSLSEERERAEEGRLEAERAKAAALQDKRAAEAAQTKLKEERTKFDKDLRNVVQASVAAVRAQDRAEAWLRWLFNEADAACRLPLLDKHGTAAFFKDNSTTLNREGRQALKDCRDNFKRLAYCLSASAGREDEDGEALPGASSRQGKPNRAAEECEALVQGAQPAIVPPIALLSGLEALVLQGNTNRLPPGNYRHAVEALRLRGKHGAALVESFMGNAKLGARRAQSAADYILRLVEEEYEGAESPLEVLMSRLRLESASFGRYQVGPRAWREKACPEGERTCEKPELVCPDEKTCDRARNLSLRVRWKKDALREPFKRLHRDVCKILRKRRGETDAEVQETIGLLREMSCPESIRQDALKD